MVVLQRIERHIVPMSLLSSADMIITSFLNIFFVFFLVRLFADTLHGVTAVLYTVTVCEFSKIFPNFCRLNSLFLNKLEAESQRSFFPAVA